MRIVPNKEKQSVLELSLKNSDRTVFIDEDDFNDLMLLDIPMEWILFLGLVWARRGRQRISIARLIRDAGKGTKVTYKDGNQLNLRRDNLIIATGAGKASPRQQLIKEKQ
jgi:hypothetical protein